MARSLRHVYDTKQFVLWQVSRRPNHNRRLKERENKASRKEKFPHEGRVQGTARCGSNHIFSLIMILTCFVVACDMDASSIGLRHITDKSQGRYNLFSLVCLAIFLLLSLQHFLFWIFLIISITDTDDKVWPTQYA